MEPYWDVIERIIKESDIVLEILDARLVELTRNAEVERLIKQINRPLIFVLNKSDLVSRKFLKKQADELRKHGEVVFVSTKKGNIKILFHVIRKVFKKYGKREMVYYEAKKKPREVIGDIVVGVLGYPNVGKSSIINRLSFKKKTKVSKRPGTTHGLHWIKATSEIKLIDSPGVIPLEKQDEAKMALMSAKSIDRLNDSVSAAEAVIKLFNINKKNFEDFYKVKIEEPYETILEVAKKKSFLLKKGELDEDRASKLIIKDWQEGKLRL